MVQEYGFASLLHYFYYYYYFIPAMHLSCTWATPLCLYDSTSYLPDCLAVEAVHALLEAKGKQMFVKALVGESMLDKSYSYVDGQELRPRVSYLLASGCQLAFGESMHA